MLKQKNHKLTNYLSNASMALGVLIGGYGLVKIYRVRASLPPGVCPIDNNRPLLFTAIGFLIISLALSYLFDWQSKELEESPGQADFSDDEMKRESESD